MRYIHSFLLLRYPKALARLRQEIKAISPDGEDLTRAQINKMTYLKHILKESEWNRSCNPNRC